MEPFNINLNQMAETSGKYKRFVLILVVATIVIAIALYFIFPPNGKLNLWLLLSIVANFALFGYFAYSGYIAKLYFSSDDYAIEYQFGFLKKRPITIIWQTINKVKIGPTYISFLKRSGRGKKIELGWLPYKKVLEIKERVQEYAKAKEINIEIAEYNKL